MLSTTYFQFAWEQTGVLIEQDVLQSFASRPADFDTITNVVFNDFKLARVVDITNSKVNYDEFDKQNSEGYLLYLDRSLSGRIKEGNRVKFRRDMLGMNKLFIDDNSENVIVSYIRKVVTPQNMSTNGSLHCYLSTNN